MFLLRVDASSRSFQDPRRRVEIIRSYFHITDTCRVAQGVHHVADQSRAVSSIRLRKPN
jgi:hypothetical protein